MTFIVGFLVWTAIGVVAGLIMPRAYKAAATEPLLTVVFGFFGAFIGGMLGTSPYIFHDPTPLRVGSLIGAVLGAIIFTFMYHFIARKAI
jgi:uncharacterized membrane protein YeaQ/YmgE (transglycosylase-associated protein family)